MASSRGLQHVRRQLRRRYRSGRRITLGAARLGPMATAGWLASEVGDRIGARRASGPVQNSAFTWAPADDGATTVVWVHNYWSDAYKIDELDMAASLIDAHGAVATSWSFRLERDATVVIDVRQECRRAGVALPFTGQLLLEATDERLVARRPVQVFAEYRDDGGNWTGVHGQYGHQVRPVAQGVGEMRIAAGPDVRSGLVVVNGYAGPGGRRPIRPQLEVRDARGRERWATLPPLEWRGTNVVWLDEAFPGLAEFLDNKPGSVAAHLPCPSSRLACFSEFGDGRRIVNHGTVDGRFTQQPGGPLDWTGSRYVASCFALCADRRDTRITLVNTWGPIPSDYTACLRLSGPDGSLLATHRLEVPRGGCAEVSTRDLLVAAGVDLPVAAHVEVTLEPRSAVDELPILFNLIVGIVDDGALVGEELVGGGYFNAEPPPGSGVPDIRRTRIFARAHVGAGTRTKLFLAHPVGGGDDYDVVATAQLTLLDLSGTHKLTSEVALAPHGCALLDVEETFAGAGELLAPAGGGAVRVRSTDARLVGSHIVEREGSVTTPVDHLVGG